MTTTPAGRPEPEQAMLKALEDIAPAGPWGSSSRSTIEVLESEDWARVTINVNASKLIGPKVKRYLLAMAPDNVRAMPATASWRGMAMWRTMPATAAANASATSGTRRTKMREDGMDAAVVLDPCCGSRMMWFDKADQRAIFGDRRSETITVTDRSHREDGTRTLRIEPDTVMDFRALPFPAGRFKLVAFDPPHLVRAGPRSWLAAKYGKLGQDWRDDLRQGFAECWRVLAPEGVLVFKWNETQVRVGEVLPLAPDAPLFGQVSGRGGLTHWLVFMKPAATPISIPAGDTP